MNTLHRNTTTAADHLAAMQRCSESMSQEVLDIKARIADGTYETPQKTSVAVGRLIDASGVLKNVSNPPTAEQYEAAHAAVADDEAEWDRENSPDRFAD